MALLLARLSLIALLSTTTFSSPFHPRQQFANHGEPGAATTAYYGPANYRTTASVEPTCTTVTYASNTATTTASNVSGASSTGATISSYPTTSATISSLLSTTLSTGAPSSVTASLATTTCTSLATPPAPMGEGTVAGCTLWYVAEAGDFCYSVAQQFDISVEQFMAWNPSVVPPTCQRMMVANAYCVQVCDPSTSASSAPMPSTSSSGASSTTSASTVPASFSSTTATSVPAAPSATKSPGVVYRSYNGDGSATQGWPTEDQWTSFESMFDANRADMEVACEAWGVPNNSADEIETMRQQLISISDETAIDPRFILAIIMQESTGCVRVITTSWSHANPGLMQSFNGTGGCNANSAYLGLPGVDTDGEVQTPCPESEIRQQILDGTNGTVWGPGLVQDMREQGNTDSSRWYRTARLYNGGQIVKEDLSLPCCTPSYASDIANRLMGWTTSVGRTFVPA